ncbi:hypothetical protein J8138_15005 [Lactiplantibacillus plantarum]|jgi:hypothetical protein|uniref:Uncharacterized protein n=2 Tax=Lactobacillales TaxID=186826 RepID=A0ABP2B752_9LACO|nr:hypothetical protein [Lactiplantibacillus plantarum]MBJ7623169.1 hypothetical protein [Weissella confusa]OQJ70559.1 hypothetical protein BMS77_08955 [Leuconostoc pseudomesenteroides]RKD20854.1 hypothetical protein BG617_15320 [Lactiplantibacillus paraplantarum]CUW12410.1 hypothetical protein C122C_0163 [Leuconostoc gasicomitatum]GEK64597.1 hypothetical protein LJA01_25000 [Lactobacillus japonicus]
MGNLGWYQLMTTVAKKVGGPKQLLALVAAGGYVIIRGVEAGGKKVIKLVKKDNKEKSTSKVLPAYKFIIDGKDDKGLIFSSGDVFYVAARHDDVILIEKEKDDNNPYFVSVDWLMKVSSFKDNN